MFISDIDFCDEFFIKLSEMLTSNEFDVSSFIGKLSPKCGDDRKISCGFYSHVIQIFVFIRIQTKKILEIFHSTHILRVPHAFSKYPYQMYAWGVILVSPLTFALMPFTHNITLKFINVSVHKQYSKKLSLFSCIVHFLSNHIFVSFTFVH